ncbi:hypothetical protein GLOIN_2v1762606 [Rhizophagus irregularis DAOM 181602=DAOM 197198]|nr:hypothetical protein GLOIN_2v1762606 [Rhizophagus irregularis DAOM 181602=DAOM 197198]
MDIRAVVAIDFGTTFSNVIKWGNPALAQRQSVKVKIHHLQKLNVGKLVKETISTRWQGIKFFEHVLLVISIPAKFDDRAKDTMRKCFHNAGLTNSKESNKWEKRKTFKLHLEIPQNEKPPLPYQLSYEKTITRKVD